MKIKRFVAPDMRQAMKQARDTLGPDAVILSNKIIAEGVELMAAMDFDQQEVQETKEQVKPIVTKAPVVASTPPVELEELKAMRQEMRQLQNFMRTGMNELGWQDMERKQPQNTDLLYRLLSLGISANLAQKITAKIRVNSDSEQLWQHALADLEQRIPVSTDDLLEYGGIVALVGPTGVGKTTTIAKLATRFAMKHGSHQVALVTTDNFRIGAREQLQTYGKILNIPVSMVQNPEEMTACLNSLARYRLVLIDTAGMALDDERFKAQMNCLNKSQRTITKLLTLSAATEKTALDRVIAMYEALPVDGCILTKLDESASLGGVLSSIIEHNLPLTYQTDGQKVPEDLHLVRSRALIDKANRLISEKNQPFDPAYMAYAYGGAQSYAQL